MSNAYSKDLERWMPRLIAVWRASRGRGDGPETRLTRVTEIAKRAALNERAYPPSG